MTESQVRVLFAAPIFHPMPLQTNGLNRNRPLGRIRCGQQTAEIRPRQLDHAGSDDCDCGQQQKEFSVRKMRPQAAEPARGQISDKAG